MDSDTAMICRRALGYLELGMAEDAWEELSTLPREEEWNPQVRQLRVEVLGRLRRWAEGAALCLPMLDRQPEVLFWWIQGAYCQRRAQSIEAADQILKAALIHHPPEGILIYNLACYACVQGSLEEARELLGRAISQGPAETIAMALRDEDLFALRPWILQREEELRFAALPILPP